MRLGEARATGLGIEFWRRVLVVWGEAGEGLRNGRMCQDAAWIFVNAAVNQGQLPSTTLVREASVTELRCAHVLRPNVISNTYDSKASHRARHD